MHAEDPTLKMLAEAVKRAVAIAIPPYLRKYYTENAEDRETDMNLGLQKIQERASNLEKPAVCLLGAFSSGKTYLLNQLIQENVLFSKIEPTTAVITVLRHIDDKPTTWSAKHNVFVLKKDFDLRSLSDNSVVAGYPVEELRNLTTYPQARNHDAVIVFLNKGILKNCIFIDCPGVGTMDEVMSEEGSEGSDATPKQIKAIREVELQNIVIKNSDAYLLLSAVTGGAGCFADNNTGTILRDIAVNMARFQTNTPHGNILFVGTQANPQTDGAHDNDETIKILCNQLRKQVKGLPLTQRNKFNEADLCRRVVLYYGLDRYQIESEIATITRQLKKYMKNSSAAEIDEEAKKNFLEEKHDKERVKAFNAAIVTMIEQLVLGMYIYRAQVSEAGINTAIIHYERKNSNYMTKVQYYKHYEDLSLRYRRESDNREKDWNGIIFLFNKNVSETCDRALEAINRVIEHWCIKDNLYQFLENQFGENKDQARAHSSAALQDQLNEEFSSILREKMDIPQKFLSEKLLAFDRKWLKRKDGENNALISVDGNGSVDGLNLSPIETFSVQRTFGAVTAGLAGGTAIAAMAGSTLAQVAMIKVIALGASVLAGVGLGATATGALLSIPVYGWIAAGVLGIGYALKNFFAWRKTMAETMAKSMQKNRKEIYSSASSAVKTVFDNILLVGQESLKISKGMLESHIRETHEIGKGNVSSKDLEMAAEFYRAHIQVLRETLARMRS